jgi:hypothetical protein
VERAVQVGIVAEEVALDAGVGRLCLLGHRADHLVHDHRVAVFGGPVEQNPVELVPLAPLLPSASLSLIRLGLRSFITSYDGPVLAIGPQEGLVPLVAR